MFDRFYLPTLLIGVLIQALARYGQGAGLFTAATQRIMYTVSLVCFALGLFLFGRVVGKTLLTKAWHKKK